LDPDSEEESKVGERSETKPIGFKLRRLLRPLLEYAFAPLSKHRSGTTAFCNILG